MAGEMINDKLSITPHRLYALVRLVDQCSGATRKQILDLLQPESLTDNQETSTIVYRYAKRFSLISEDDAKDRHVSPNLPRNVIQSFDRFRVHMQGILLGVVNENEDNYILNLFTAWYATQNEKVLSYSKSEYEKLFHQDLYPTTSERVLSEEPGISAWRTWAEFLGWGWRLQFSKSRREEMQISPDATLRVKPLLPHLLHDKREFLFGEFMDNLKPLCPELDGGILFERCWEASRGGEPRGNRLSLMLSTALRILHSQGEIELIRKPDSPDNWTLYPAQTHIMQVTHIRRKESA